MRALGRIFLRTADRNGLSPHWLRLTREDVAELRERLEPLTVRQRRRVRGLKADRADIILAGVIVIEELMTLGGYGSLVVCTHGVGDGLLLRETFDGDV